MTLTHSLDRTRSGRPLGLALLIGLLGLGLPCLGAVPAAPPQDAAPATPLKVIATTPTYCELARLLGGSLVDVIVLTRPGQDAHTVTATPSLMARVQDASLLLYTGLDAELYLDGLLRGSGNQRLLPGSPHAIALSDGIPLLEVPAVLDRSQGDVHVYGNSHVWTDPYAVRSMAARVRDALVELLPEHAAEISARHASFHEELTRALVRWLTDYKELRGRRVVVFHRSWDYFFARFGLVQEAALEPKPRVAPTASHLAEVEAGMRADDVHVIVREPYNDPQAAQFVAEATDAQVLELSTHPGFPEGVDGIIAHFDHNLAALATALGLQAHEP